MRLQHLNVDRLNHIVTRTVQLVHQLKKSQRPVLKAPDALKDILIAPEKSGFPELKGLYTHPVITPAGSLLTNPGYDKQNGLYLTLPNGLNTAAFDFLMPAEQSIDILKDLFCDFKFGDNSGFAHILAFSLTAIMRPFISGPVPAFGIIAPAPGSGKSILTRIAIAMVTGQIPADFSLPNDDAEMRKKITTLVAEGLEFICIDNADGNIDFNSLESFLTSRVWSDRRLGGNDYIRVPNNSIVTLNGNNTVLSQALTRRTIPIFIETSTERPYMRDDFKYKDIVNHVLQNHEIYLAALVSIISAWLNAGSPPGRKNLGSFEDWSAKVGGVLAFNGIDGFMDNIDSFHNKTDLETNAWSTLVNVWYETYQTEPITLDLIHRMADTLIDDYPFKFLVPPSLRGQMSALGREMQSKKGRIFNNKKIIHYGQDGHNKKQLYSLSIMN